LPFNKFEAGTPDIAVVIGVGAAVDYLEKSRPCRRSKTNKHYWNTAQKKA